MPDFSVIHDGSIILFRPLTERAKNFTQTDLQIEGWQWLGPNFGVDAGIGEELIQSLIDEGFELTQG